MIRKTDKSGFKPAARPMQPKPGKPAPPAKVKPVIGKDKIGFKITKKL